MHTSPPHRVVDPICPRLGRGCRTVANFSATGPVPLSFAWAGGPRPAAEQCKGCTFSTTHINELAYLNSRDVSYATFCQAPYEEPVVSRLNGLDGSLVLGAAERRGPVDCRPYFGILVSYLRDGGKVYETYWATGRSNGLMAPSCGLLDLAVYGRLEFGEDSPEAWPQRWSSKGGQFTLDGGRPTAQWSALRQPGRPESAFIWSADVPDAFSGLPPQHRALRLPDSP